MQWCVYLLSPDITHVIKCTRPSAILAPKMVRAWERGQCSVGISYYNAQDFGQESRIIIRLLRRRSRVSSSQVCLDFYKLQLLLPNCIDPLQLLLPNCVRFSCCSPFASASAAALGLLLHQLLPNCICFGYCSLIASASTATPQLHPLVAPAFPEDSTMFSNILRGVQG